MRFVSLAKLVDRLTAYKLRQSADVYIGGVDNPYLLRWYLIPRNRFFNAYLHMIVRSDDDRALHDHPWWSLSLLLAGKVKEVLPDGHRQLQRGDIVLRSATMAHRLELADKTWCRTLFLTGPRIREWGFHCPKGFVPWEIFTGFNETGDSTTIGRGCD